MSVNRLSGMGPFGRSLAIFGLFFWAFITLFPLYWVMVTAFRKG